MNAPFLFAMTGKKPGEIGSAGDRAARATRPAPRLDPTAYLDVNAQVVSALLAGATALDELNRMTGLARVKAEIGTLISRLQVSQDASIV